MLDADVVRQRRQTGHTSQFFNEEVKLSMKLRAPEDWKTPQKMPVCTKIHCPQEDYNYTSTTTTAATTQSGLCEVNSATVQI